MEFILTKSNKYNIEKPIDDSRLYQIEVKCEFQSEPQKVWAIKINSLKELMNLRDITGNLIITTFEGNRNYCELLIYDGYIE